MRKLLQHVCIAIAAMSLTAFQANATVYNSHSAKSPKSEARTNPKMPQGLELKKELDKGNKIYSSKNDKTSVLNSRSEEELIEVNFALDFDNEYFFLWNTSVFNDNLYYEDYEYDRKAKIVTVYIAPGTYDLMLYFGYNYNGDMADAKFAPGHRVIFKENVSLTEDTTIDISIDECANRIHCDTYMPNGELPVLPTYTLLDEAPWIKWDFTDSNVSELWFEYYVMVGDDIIIEGFGNGGNQNSQPLLQYDFYVNDCSDRLYIRQFRTILPRTNEFYISTFYTTGSESRMIETLPADYESATVPFKITPLGEDSPLGHYPGIETIVMIDGVQNGGVSGNTFIDITGEKEVTIYNTLTRKEMEKDPNHFGIMIMPQIGDYQYEYTYVEDYGDGEIYEETRTLVYNTIGLPMIYDGDKIEFVNKGHDAYGNYGFQLPEDPETTVIEYPGHPVFSYDKSQLKTSIGNSAPVAAVMAQNYYNSWYETKLSSTTICYIGHAGEILMSDCVDLDMDYKFDGIQRATKYEQFDSLISVMVQNKEFEGVFDITYTNKNVSVDGIPGYNRTHIVYDGAKEDNTAPTMQMLQFRNINGDIIDRFETGDEGLLEFAGGDFNFQFSEEPYYSYFDCKEQDVKVEYAPYGSENWKELPFEEIPDLKVRPAFGYFYRASLDAVTGYSENAWWDLRITLTDKAGNYQEQVISPSFKIETSNSINAIFSNTGEIVNTEFFTIDGRKANANTQGFVIRCDSYSDGTQNRQIVKQ